MEGNRSEEEEAGNDHRARLRKPLFPSCVLLTKRRLLATEPILVIPQLPPKKMKEKVSFFLSLTKCSSQDSLPFSRELWILSSVFLMRRAVSLAEGFWYQHSFISFTRAERVCEEQRDGEREFRDQCGCRSPLMFLSSALLHQIWKNCLWNCDGRSTASCTFDKKFPLVQEEERVHKIPLFLFLFSDALRSKIFRHWHNFHLFGSKHHSSGFEWKTHLMCFNCFLAWIWG